MSRSIEHRLAALERAVAARQESPMSDGELAEALSNQTLEEADVRALYRRIEGHLAASVLCHASAMNHWWGKGMHEDPVGPLTIVTAHLAWQDGSSPPREIVSTPDLSLEREVPLRPSARRLHHLDWQLRIRVALMRNLIAKQGRSALRARIGEYLESDVNACLEVVPHIDSAERAALLDIVEPLETIGFDMPLLMWFDDNGLNSSHKHGYYGSSYRDNTGQTWTILSRSGRTEEE